MRETVRNRQEFFRPYGTHFGAAVLTENEQFLVDGATPDATAFFLSACEKYQNALLDLPKTVRYYPAFAFSNAP